MLTENASGSPSVDNKREKIHFEQTNLKVPNNIGKYNYIYYYYNIMVWFH